MLEHKVGRRIYLRLLMRNSERRIDKSETPPRDLISSRAVTSTSAQSKTSNMHRSNSKMHLRVSHMFLEASDFNKLIK